MLRLEVGLWRGVLKKELLQIALEEAVVDRLGLVLVGFRREVPI